MHCNKLNPLFIMYFFNVKLLKEIYVVCGFKSAAQFIKDYPYSYVFWYKSRDREDMRLCHLLKICEQYKLNPFIFFMHPKKKMQQLHTNSTFHPLWQDQNYIMLPDGTIKTFMDMFDFVPYQKRRRLLRANEEEESTMNVSHFLHAINTYDLRPEDLILPDEQEKKTYR